MANSPQFVPDDMLTPELRAAVATSNAQRDQALQLVPDDMLTPELRAMLAGNGAKPPTDAKPPTESKGILSRGLDLGLDLISDTARQQFPLTSAILTPENSNRPGFTGAFKNAITTLGLTDEVAAYTANPTYENRKKLLDAANPVDPATGKPVYQGVGFGEGENFEAFKEMLGGSLGQMVAPVVAGYAASLPFGAAAAAETATVVGAPLAIPTLGAGFIAGTSAALATGTAQYTVTNALRQAEEQQKAAEKNETPKEFSLTKAFVAAVPQALLDQAELFVFGPLFSKIPLTRVLVTPAGKATETAIGNIVNAAQNGTLRTIAGGVTRGVVEGVVFEVPTEIAQQTLERWQAGLSLTDKEALGEYKQAAIGAALLGPVFGAPSGALGSLRKRDEALEILGGKFDPENAQQTAVRLLDPASYDPNLIKPGDNSSPVAPQQTAAEIEETLARKKANALNGSEGIEPIVERITDANETVEDTIAAANLAAGTVPNPVAVPDFVAQGYKIVPNVSEEFTRLVKTNDDATVNTVDIGPNGDVENDTTILGSFTVNEAPVSVRFDNRRSILQGIEEDGSVTDLSDKANRRYTAGDELLAILRDEDTNVTVEPVVRAETVAPAPVVTQTSLFSEPTAIEQNRDRSNPASVLQMQQIANAPDYGRAGVGRSLANDAPVVAGGEIPADQLGKKDYAVDSEGKRVNIQYAVVDASTVQTSNTVDGAVNPDYAGTEDLRAIAGNGRITGFSEAYVRGTADNYRGELEADTAHGVAPEVIRNVPNPILVRVMSETDITSDMGDRTNTATQLGMSPEETARNDANRVDLNELTFRENGEPTAEATRAFLRGLPANERATLLNGQVPTSDATTRLERAVFLKAYNDSALMDQLTTSEDGRTVISALTQLAPTMSRLSDAGELDIRDIVVDAAKIVIKARRDGVSLANAARQTDIEFDPNANLIVALMAEKPGGVKNTVEVLRSVAEFAQAEAAKPETDMFGPVPRATRADVIAKLRAALAPASAELVMPAVASAPAQVSLPATETAKQSDLETRIADLNVRADTQGRKTVAGRLLDLTAKHLAAPTTESRTKLELALTNKTAKAGTNAQVVEAVAEARAALAPVQTEQAAPLAVGDSVRVGNAMGVVVGVENGYIKFHPINANNPKAYQRVPITTATFLSRPDTSATSAKSEMVGLTADLTQLAERFGADMYGSNLMEVVVKEGLQNSFDAVKGRLFLQMQAAMKNVATVADFEKYLLANPKIFGHVKVTLNSIDRTVTFSDDGVGMSPDIVKNAFLTIAASDKAGLPPGLASGGLGLAKMGILMGAARIQLTTVKDGEQTSIDTTKTELLKKATTFNVSKTEKPSGTTLALTIPETYIAKNGDAVDIFFNSNPEYVTALKRPLIGPVEVEVTTVNNSGTSTKVIATGTNFDKSQYQKVKTADTDWGLINIYFGVEREQYPKHVVLSSGVYQFDYDVRDASYKKIPFNIVINIQPKDKASDRDYPFENNRERFKPRVEKDLDALKAYLFAIAQGESAKDLKEGFKDVVSMPRIEVGAALADNSKKLKKAFDARGSGEVQELAPLPNEVTITSGNVIDRKGAVIAQSDAAAKESEKKAASTFVEKEAAPDMSAFMSDMKANPLQPVFLNNTSVDYLAVGRPYGNPEAFFAELGTLMVEMKEELAKSGLYGYDALSAKDLFFGGIAIDRKYGGIHIKVPFKAVFVNPFYDWGAKTLFGVRGNLYETMTHEIAHVRDMRHGVGHNNEMIQVRQYLEDEGMEQYFRDAILDLLTRHESTFTAMRTAYGLSTTKNTGKSLEEYEANAPSTSVGGSATGTQGELGPVRAGEGLGRGGDLQAAGGASEQSQIGGGVGRSAAVTAWARDTFGDRTAPDGSLVQQNFLRWFGNSVMVNAAGNPLVAYHATTADITAFDLDHPNRKDAGWLGYGVYLTDSTIVANAIADKKAGANVMPFYVNLKNPYRATLEEKNRIQRIQLSKGMVAARKASREWTEKLQSQGYDGVVLEAMGAQEIVVFDTAGVKSATGNNGQFSLNTDDIRYSVKSDKMGATGTAKAWVEFAEVKKLIDFGVVKTLAQAKTAAEADYKKTFDVLPAFNAKVYLEGVVAVEGPLLPPNVHAAIEAYRNGNEGGAVGTLLSDVTLAREENVARWKNYFDNVNTEQGSDPFWKSYVAHGVVNTFDATKPNTGETFNAAALATVYGKFLEGTAPNFTKAYRAAKMAATTDLVQLGDAQNGWRKVPQTDKSDPNFAERVAEVQAISSESWCTRTYNAAPYIQNGDFWVYVDKGRPELAIRFEGPNVAEIQGRSNNGSIPTQYADKVQELVDSGKIKNLNSNTKKALQAATDKALALKRLESETTFVEELVKPYPDNVSTRVYVKTNGDIVLVTEGAPVLTGKYADRVVEIIGDITLRGSVQANSLTTVGGDLILREGAQANSLTTVGGDLILREGAQVNSLTTVGGDLILRGSVQANSVTTVVGDLILREGAQANSVTTVGGYFTLYAGAQANSVTTVGGNFYLYDGAQANSVTTVGGYLYLREGAQALSLQAVGGDAIGATPKNAPNLRYIGNKAAVERIKAQTLPIVAQFSRQSSMSIVDVQAAIAGAGNLRIKTTVYATAAEASAATGVDVPADAQGMYFRNELHFIAENISSTVDAEIVIWHEVTHAGLDRLYGMGSAQYNAALTTIALQNPNIRKEAAKWRAKFGADILQRALGQGLSAEKADQYVRIRAIDEALAVMSGQNVTIRGLDKFIAAVQKILRQVGLTKLANAMEGKTNAEALALINQARGAVLADGSYVVTGNAPAFSMGNRTEPTLPVPVGRKETLQDQTTYNFVDRFVDVKNLMKTIKGLVTTLPETLDAYSMIERLTSIVAKKVEDFGTRELGPLITEMKARGVSVAELDNYLWMRGAPDANRIIAAQPDSKFPDGGAGVTTADARAYLASLTAEQQKAFEALAKRVDAITAKTRREWVVYGMATLDDVLKMEREQPFYVPFHREGKGLGTGSGKGVSVRGPNTYHRRGSTRPVVDVLANIVHQRDRAITRGEKNRVARVIYALAKAFPDADVWSLAKPSLTSAIDANTGEPVDVLDMSYQKDDNVLMSIRLDSDGKMVAQGVTFNEDNEQALRMVGALKNLDLPSLQGIIGGTALVTRYFAALATQYNPVFGLWNLSRDVQTGLLNLSSTPIAGKQRELFGHVGPALASIYKGEREKRGGRASAATPYDLYFERLQNAGGTSGWRQSYETSADRGKALQKELDSLSNGTAKKILPAIGGWLSDYNTAMENSTRLAAFIVAVESGMSDAQAASLAKNLTVNFDRKGAKSSQFGAVFAFFNPSLQGTVRTLETLKGPAGKKIIAGGLLLGAMQSILLAIAGFEDDDPPEFVRQRNLIIPTGNGKYVMFPMPLSFNLIPNIGRLAMQTVIQPKNIGKNAFAVLDATVSTLNPFGSGLTAQTITPTALDPFMAILSNKDWTGRPISREDFSALDPTPGFTRAKDNATAVSRVIAETINTLTLGNKYTPGGWSPTPDLIDYMGGQLTGGPGRELLNLESSVEGWLNSRDVPSYKIPVIGKLYGNTKSEASEKAKYYENITRINELENNVKGMQKDRVSSAAFRQDNPEVRIIPAANIIKREISQFRKQKDRPNNDDAKTDALILRQMQRLNALADRYDTPTAQQEFLRSLAPN